MLIANHISLFEINHLDSVFTKKQIRLPSGALLHLLHPNGGVRGGTIRLLPVDSKAEAKRSRLLSS